MQAGFSPLPGTVNWNGLKMSYFSVLIPTSRKGEGGAAGRRAQGRRGKLIHVSPSAVRGSYTRITILSYASRHTHRLGVQPEATRGSERSRGVAAAHSAPAQGVVGLVNGTHTVV